MYNKDFNEVLKIYNSSENGLKYKQIENSNYKKNVITSEKKESLLIKFIKEFNDLMIIILFISAFISFIISYINHESYIDSIVIILIVIINAVLGFIQELKADKALDSLKKMQITSVKVRREGIVEIIDSEDLIPGDIILLEAGDIIPSDGRIIWSGSLKVDESSLTGESVPVLKTAKKLKDNLQLADQTNMIFMGTNVVYGKCEAVITSTGMDTEFGKIAASLETTDKEITPLEQKINSISKFISFIIMIIILVMFIIGLLKGMQFTEILLLSISLAVAAIPEGLPAIITITLSLGVANMAKKKAIVRKLSSVETLGCTEIICSDKTGTITQNKMTVEKVYFNNHIYDINEKFNKELLEIIALNNDVLKSKRDYIGDPTEVALYVLCEKHGLNIEEIKRKHPRIQEIPFDSERKLMTTINTYGKNNKVITKGSFDSLIKCCNYIYNDGKILKLNNKKINELKAIEKELSNQAYRIIAYAYKDITSKDSNKEYENDLIFIGLTCMMDPPRKDVKSAIKSCVNANIRPIMITGDSIDTAEAIASYTGILTNDYQSITGAELDKMSFDELVQNIEKYSVYARVSPMNKLDIVNAWKEKGKIVAMTGDGVNDAPALKSAIIGVGMGISGTEVSKNVSDIVLSDDSFSTIVSAVKEGRRIFDNIRNVLVYLLTGNLTEILIVFIGMMFGIEIFIPIQLLYINLITDSIPAIALSFEPEADDIMKREIRKNNDSFFTPFMLSKIVIESILKTIVILFIYFISKSIYGIQVAATMAFLSITLIEMIYAITCKNIKENIINEKLFKNKQLNISILILSILQIILFITPLRSIFSLSTLTISQVMICLLFVLISFIIDELIKRINVKLFKD